MQILVIRKMLDLANWYTNLNSLDADKLLLQISTFVPTSDLEKIKQFKNGERLKPLFKQAEMAELAKELAKCSEAMWEKSLAVSGSQLEVFSQLPGNPPLPTECEFSWWLNW